MKKLRVAGALAYDVDYDYSDFCYYFDLSSGFVIMPLSLFLLHFGSTTAVISDHYFAQLVLPPIATILVFEVQDDCILFLNRFGPQSAI